jgi:signal transduction histidine kinase/DNA-binding response OmpR family regulator/serine phosphatase RsbU (regulator of sigma subunit)/anti-sigma regulatory factor (Ser/Thr protein kinase)
MSAPAPGGEIRDVLAASGEVGNDLLAVDWAATPLGPPERWPQSLKTVVGMVLTSRFSMWMAWGPDLTFFCNEAYRRDTLGEKYPWALGRPAREVWEEIWPDIGPRIETVMRTGVATWDEALLLFLERSGYAEETYHTFSYSPLIDDDGAIAGMLCVVTEDTDRVIGERRMATLRDLGSDPTSVRTEAEVIAAACRHLEANQRSLPFTLTYLFDDEGDSAHLAGATGVPAHHPAAPLLLGGGWTEPIWPVADALAGTTVVVDLDHRFGTLPTGAWDEPPRQAMVAPLLLPGQPRPIGLLVAGLNRYRKLDVAYRDFVALVARQIASALAGARAYEAERQRAEALAEIDRAKTAFFTNVSHELRTPLTLLLGPAEDSLADRGEPLPLGQRHRVEVIHRNAERLLKLVNTLLDFSRLQSESTVAHFEPVDLARYTSELASMFESAVERAGLVLTIDCPPLSQPVFVDREMWAKIVLNLVSNALKFTFTGGITVRVDAADGGARLSVADTGIGIPGIELPRLFERFHRVTGARARTFEGSGIGLALVAELAELHGGSAAAASTPGDGSIFTVRVPFGHDHLPVAQVAGDAQADTPAEAHAVGFLAEAQRWLEATPDGAAPTARRDGRPTVLVVDDNADMREYVAGLLGERYTVHTAPDGADALEMARAGTPDLVLTDVMMPRLDGFGLLAGLRADPGTATIPVIMVSARAGEEGTIEGLEAGADDYLVKPFSARELLARVHANLELERAKRARDTLRRNQALLDQAQRLSGVGSWEIELATGAVRGSEEFLRQVELTPEQLATQGFEGAIAERVHPDDMQAVREAVAGAASGEGMDLEVRLVQTDGTIRIYRALGELERDEDEQPVRLRGSIQDITSQREAEQAMAAVAAEREAAARERMIADELQRSLLPDRSFDPEHLEVATSYHAGVEGTQVGGDWYDVIALGAGRTALVLGDVMGRGVQAAAVMGQLRAAVRAYAQLDLPPGDVLEHLDGVVRELGEDQIVTCVYAVFDARDRSLTYANAGHLPPLLSTPGEPARRLTEAGGPPLGSGPVSLGEERVELPVGALLVLYTDGLVERRDRNIDDGIDVLTAQVERLDGPIESAPERLVAELAGTETDDDVAVLVARVPGGPSYSTDTMAITPEPAAVPRARRFVTTTFERWEMPHALIRDAVLLVSELVTNAIVHGRPPIELVVRRTADHVVIEVDDGATVLPRKLRPTAEDEHGRGLQLAALLADRWGTRPLRDGKSVWCVLTIARYGGQGSAEPAIA